MLAGILVPASVVASWARTEILDEQAFVQTFAPLSSDPGVQRVVITRTSAAVSDVVNVRLMTDDLLGELDALELSAPARAAIRLLRVPIAAGVHSIIDRSITRVVESDTFSGIWQRSLIASHRALVAVATNDETHAISVDDAGALGVNVGPIIDEVKQALLGQGFRFAAALPSTDRTIVIVKSDSLLFARSAYLLALRAGLWMPLVCLALFVVGFVLARRRRTALVGTGVAIAIGASILIGTIGAGRSALGRAESAIPPATLDTLYFAVAGAMRSTAIVLVVVGVALALGAWLSGPWSTAARTRTFEGTG